MVREGETGIAGFSPCLHKGARDAPPGATSKPREEEEGCGLELFWPITKFFLYIIYVIFIFLKSGYNTQGLCHSSSILNNNVQHQKIQHPAVLLK